MAWLKGFYEGDRPWFVPEDDWNIVTHICWPYNVNPYFIAAIGWHETNWGRAGAGRQGYHLGVSVYPPHYGLEQFRGVRPQVLWAAKRINLYMISPITLQAAINWNRAVGYSLHPESWGRSVYSIFDQLMRTYAHRPGSPCPYTLGPEEGGNEPTDTWAGAPITGIPTRGGIWDRIGSTINSYLVRPLNKLFGFLGANPAAVLQVLGKVINRIRWVFEHWWGMVWEFGLHFLGNLNKLLRRYFELLWNFLAHVAGNLYKLITKFWSLIWKFFSRVAQFVYWIVIKYAGFILKLLTEVAGKAYKLITSFWDLIWKFFSQIARFVYWIVKKYASLIVKFLETLVEWLWPFISDFPRSLANLLPEIIGWVLVPVLMVLVRGLKLIAGHYIPPAPLPYPGSRKRRNP